MRVLVAYSLASTFVQTTMDYLMALKKHLRAEVDFVHVTHGAVMDFDLQQYDVVFHNYCARLCFPDYVSPHYLAALRRFGGVKILAVQDEYDDTDTLRRAILDLGFDVVLTCVPDEARDYVYPPDRFGRVRFERVLTGYVADDFDALHGAARPVRDRPIVLGYRGRDIGGRYGRLGYEKYIIGVRMKEICAARGVPCDIAVDEDSRIYGAAWFDFVGSCRAMLGSESGSNIFDFDGSIARAYREMAAARGGMVSYEEFAPFVRAHEDKVDMGQISPRVFECAVMRTPMVLFRGRYSDALEPETHYIPLEKDFSNADAVLARLDDVDALEAMATRAYDHLVRSGEFGYRAFVASLERIFREVAAGKTRGTVASPPSAPHHDKIDVHLYGERPTPAPGTYAAYLDRRNRDLASVYVAEVARLDRVIADHLHILQTEVARLDRLHRDMALSDGTAEGLSTARFDRVCADGRAVAQTHQATAAALTEAARRGSEGAWGRLAELLKSRISAQNNHLAAANDAFAEFMASFYGAEVARLDRVIGEHVGVLQTEVARLVRVHRDMALSDGTAEGLSTARFDRVCADVQAAGLSHQSAGAALTEAARQGSEGAWGRLVELLTSRIAAQNAQLASVNHAYKEVVASFYSAEVARLDRVIADHLHILQTEVVRLDRLHRDMALSDGMAEGLSTARFDRVCADVQAVAQTHQATAAALTDAARQGSEGAWERLVELLTSRIAAQNAQLAAANDAYMEVVASVYVAEVARLDRVIADHLHILQTEVARLDRLHRDMALSDGTAEGLSTARFDRVCADVQAAALSHQSAGAALTKKARQGGDGVWAQLVALHEARISAQNAHLAAANDAFAEFMASFYGAEVARLDRVIGEHVGILHTEVARLVRVHRDMALSDGTAEGLSTARFDRVCADVQAAALSHQSAGAALTEKARQGGDGVWAQLVALHEARISAQNAHLAAANDAFAEFMASFYGAEVARLDRVIGEHVHILQTEVARLDRVHRETTHGPMAQPLPTMRFARVCADGCAAAESHLAVSSALMEAARQGGDGAWERLIDLLQARIATQNAHLAALIDAYADVVGRANVLIIADALATQNEKVLQAVGAIVAESQRMELAYVKELARIRSALDDNESTTWLLPLRLELTLSEPPTSEASVIARARRVAYDLSAVEDWTALADYLRRATDTQIRVYNDYDEAWTVAMGQSDAAFARLYATKTD